MGLEAEVLDHRDREGLHLKFWGHSDHFTHSLGQHSGPLEDSPWEYHFSSGKSPQGGNPAPQALQDAPLETHSVLTPRGPQREGVGVDIDIWGSTTGLSHSIRDGEGAGSCHSDRSPLLGEHTPLCSSARAEADQPAVHLASTEPSQWLILLENNFDLIDVGHILTW